MKERELQKIIMHTYNIRRNMRVERAVRGTGREKRGREKERERKEEGNSLSDRYRIKKVMKVRCERIVR